MSLHKNTLLLHFALAGSGAFACLAWLLLIPGDAKNALVAGYSAARLGLAAVLLACVTGCAVLAALSYQAMGRWEEKSRVFITRRGWVVALAAVLSILCLVFGLALLWLPPDRLGDAKYAFARLKPLVAWASLVCFQAVIFCGQAYAPWNPSNPGSIKADFSQSVKRLRGDWKLIQAMAAGGLGGALLAFAIRPAAHDVFKLLPELGLAGLGFGLCVLFLGMLYNRTLVKILPYSLVILAAVSIIYNMWTGPAGAKRFNAQLRVLEANDAVTLGNRYHYSLSVYHVLSKLYPDGKMLAEPGLLKAWNLDGNQLAGWVPLIDVQEYAYDPVLNAGEAEQILAQHPVKVEINTLEGTRYYYFLPDLEKKPSTVVLFYQDNRRFILPVEQFNQLVPQRALIP